MNGDFNFGNLEGAKQFLDDLERTSRDRYFRLCYAALIASPEEVLNNCADINLKLKGLSKLITYFEHKEEFEKCLELKKLKKLL